MSEPVPTCPCGDPDYRIEVNISAIIAINPDEVTLDIEGSVTYPRLGDVFCCNCGRRTVAQYLHDGHSPANHRAVVGRVIEALEAFDATLDLREARP